MHGTSQPQSEPLDVTRLCTGGALDLAPLCWSNRGTCLDHCCDKSDGTGEQQAMSALQEDLVIDKGPAFHVPKEEATWKAFCAALELLEVHTKEELTEEEVALALILVGLCTEDALPLAHELYPELKWGVDVEHAAASSMAKLLLDEDEEEGESVPSPEAVEQRLVKVKTAYRRVEKQFGLKPEVWIRALKKKGIDSEASEYFQNMLSEAKEVDFKVFLTAINGRQCRSYFMGRGLLQLSNVYTTGTKFVSEGSLRRAVTVSDLPFIEGLLTKCFGRLMSVDPSHNILRTGHDLPPFQAWVVYFVAKMTVLLAAGAGALSAYSNYIVTDASVSEDQLDSSALYYTATTCLSIALSLVEILLLYLFGFLATLVTVRIYKQYVYPSDKTGALILGALVRSALDLGHHDGQQMGVDPLKYSTGLYLVFIGLVMASKRAVLRFILKLLVTRLGPRVAIKQAQVADLYIQIFVNAVTSFVTSWYAMKEMQLVCRGPLQYQELLQMLLARHYSGTDMSDETKLAAMKVVGLTVTNAGVMHPNLLLALDYMAGIWREVVDRMSGKVEVLFDDDGTFTPTGSRRVSRVSIKPALDVVGEVKLKLLQVLMCRSSQTAAQRRREQHLVRLNERLKPLHLDDIDSLNQFMWGPGVEEHDRLFLALVGVLASCLDGKPYYKQWLFLRSLLACADKIPSLRALAKVRVYFVRGWELSFEDFEAVLQGTGEKECVMPWYNEFWMQAISPFTRARMWMSGLLSRQEQPHTTLSPIKSAKPIKEPTCLTP